MSAKKDYTLQGVKDVMANINKALEQYQEKSLKGMILAAIHVRRSMEKTAPKIPVDKGNLRASFFITTSKGGGDHAPGIKPEGKHAAEHQVTVNRAQAIIQGKQPVVAMGFSANYAVYVHENLQADFTRPIKIGGKLKKRRAGAGPRFFQAALEREQNEIIRILAEHSKL